MNKRIERILAILDAGNQSTTPEHQGCPLDDVPGHWVGTAPGTFEFGVSNYTDLRVEVEYIEIIPDVLDNMELT